MGALGKRKTADRLGNDREQKSGRGKKRAKREIGKEKGGVYSCITPLVGTGWKKSNIQKKGELKKTKHCRPWGGAASPGGKGSMAARVELTPGKQLKESRQKKGQDDSMLPAKNKIHLVTRKDTKGGRKPTGTGKRRKKGEGSEEGGGKAHKDVAAARGGLKIARIKPKGGGGGAEEGTPHFKNGQVSFVGKSPMRGTTSHWECM